MKSQYSFSSFVRSVIGISLLLACSQFVACSKKGDDPGPKTAAEEVTANLTASQWKVTSVTVDGTDQSALFKNFTISFSPTSFNTSNGGAVWPGNSIWTFTDNNATGFTRGDGVSVQLLEVTATSLKMSLSWSKNTFGPGRAGSIKGQHVFTMGK